MQQSLDHSVLASLAALIGLLGRAAWPMFSTRVGVLRVQLVIAVAFAAHYALLDIATAAIANALGSLQAGIALLPLRARTAWFAGCGLLVAIAGTTIASWTGPASLVAAVGQAFIVIARMQNDMGLIFRLLFVGQLLWCVHDIIVGSAVAAAADVVGLLVGGWMLAQHRTAARPAQSVAAPPRVDVAT